MKYYTYKVTFKDLPGYFYYGKHKWTGKPYFGSPKTWKCLWDQFEPEVQILCWYETEEEVRVAERSIIKETWKSCYSLNENCGGHFSEEVCRENGRKSMLRMPREVLVKNAQKVPRETRVQNGVKNAPLMNSHPNTVKVRKRNGVESMSKMPIETRMKNGIKNAPLMNSHPNTVKQQRENGRRHGERSKLNVLCVETGMVYSSTMEVERNLGIPNGNVSRSARSGGTGSAGGFHWKYTL